MSHPARYAPIAIGLHWLIALLILANIPLGWWMMDLREAGEGGSGAAIFLSYQIHKSIGIVVLVLSVLRLAWRVANPPPPLPATMARWERLAASATHFAFYGVMIGLPLSGLAYVSTGYSYDGRPFAIPTYLFLNENLKVPHIAAIAGLEAQARQALAPLALGVHWYLVWGTIGLAGLHVGAALKHQFLNRDGVLARMVPGLKPAAIDGQRPRPRWLAGAGVGLAGIAVGVVLATAGPSAPAAASPASPANVAASAPDVPAAGASAGPATATSTGQSAATSTEVTGPARWALDPAASAIRFTATHVGNTFNGSFSRFTADIRFDPANLRQSRIEAQIASTSISVDNPFVADGVRGSDGFDVTAHPDIRFVSRDLRALGGDRYEARGTLTIRGQTVPVTLPFRLTINGNRAEARGQISLDRLAFGIGQENDPSAEYVSRQAQVSIEVVALRQP